MTLCENCLTTVHDAQRVPVGPDRGNQRDPYRIMRVLCGPCASALLEGQWDVLHNRYSAERQVKRPTTSAPSATAVTDSPQGQDSEAK